MCVLSAQICMIEMIESKVCLKREQRYIETSGELYSPVFRFKSTLKFYYISSKMCNVLMVHFFLLENANIEVSDEKLNSK